MTRQYLLNLRAWQSTTLRDSGSGTCIATFVLAEPQGEMTLEIDADPDEVKAACLAAMMRDGTLFASFNVIVEVASEEKSSEEGWPWNVPVLS